MNRATVLVVIAASWSCCAAIERHCNLDDVERLGAYPAASFAPYDTRADDASVKEVHVVMSNHLDVGFNVRAWCDGDGGACTSTSPSHDGEPCRPWAAWVLNENIDTFLPRAIATADAMRNATPAPGGEQQCAADYGQSTPCCGQPSDPNTTVATDKRCPASAPTCVGYVYDQMWGHCVGPALHCPAAPAPADQIDCGEVGSSEAECAARRCCWHHGGVAPSGHWCVHPSSAPTPPPTPAPSTAPDRFIYMTQPWAASFYQPGFCSANESGVFDWRNTAGGGGLSVLECPNASQVEAFRAATARGDVWWQAFPHNAMPGLYDVSLFNASLALGARLADAFGVRRPSTYSQRDETGMTRALVPLLRANNITMISLGSGGSSGGHPVIPDLFTWRDEASNTSVLFAFDHGYGGGTHIAPNGVALYCDWNTDNGGPKSKASVEGTYANLRKRYPGARVFASTFDAFYDAVVADGADAALPVVTSEIGDTWLYGVPSDPLKNQWFREIARRRAACLLRGACDAEDTVFRNFDRLLTKIPEHTWGEDTTWYLHDYSNWTNAQIRAAMTQDNYNLTVESWREQRSYVVNAVQLLLRDASGKYRSFGAELQGALDDIAELSKGVGGGAGGRDPVSEGFAKAPAVDSETFTCGGAGGDDGDGVVLRFGRHGGVSYLSSGGVTWVREGANAAAAGGAFGNAVNLTAALGVFVYQTLDADDFTAFDKDYGNGGCGPTTENPGCHNFNKPNMSSANPQHNEAVPTATALWSKDGGCHFLVEATMPDELVQRYGAPARVWSEIKVAAGEAGAANAGSVHLDFSVGWQAKTTTRLAEASWVAFVPTVASPSDGWRIASLGSNVDPTDVVEHGAVHLHSMAPDSAMRYVGPEGMLAVSSLDAPIVSCGVLSPFPTPGDNAPSTLRANMANGMLWNVNNNIWNTNFPQWYPFEGVFGYGNGGAPAPELGSNAVFRFTVTASPKPQP